VHFPSAFWLAGHGAESVSSPLLHGFGFVLAYIGPDQLLPLTSLLGAITGIILIFWNYVAGLIRRFKALLPGRAASKADPTPHRQ
jgi:hypothetical protein